MYSALPMTNGVLKVMIGSEPKKHCADPLEIISLFIWLLTFIEDNFCGVIFISIAIPSVIYFILQKN